MDVLSFLIGGTSLLGFAADIIAVITFVVTVFKGQKVDIPRKVGTIVFIFLISYTLWKIPKVLNFSGDNFDKFFDYAIYGFSVVYLFVAFLTIIMASIVLKGVKDSLNSYLIYFTASVISYALSIVLVFMLPENLHLKIFSFLFFVASIIQLLFIAGEYILKRYLVQKNYETDKFKFGEYRLTVKELFKDLKEAKNILKIPDDMLKRTEKAYESQEEEENSILQNEKISYTHFGYDAGFTILTMTLGVLLLIIKM